MTCQFVFSATSPWWNFCRPPPAVGPWIPHHLRPPKRWGVCASLNWEHRIAIPDCAPNPTPAWFCVSPSPRGPCRYLMHEPCSDPTAQQLKVLLTGPLIVCVCCHQREHRPAALIPLALDGSGASCYSCRAGKLSTANRVWLCVIGAPSHLDKKKQHLLLYQCVPSLHTHTRQKPPTTGSIKGFLPLSNIQSIKHLRSAMWK